MDTRRRKSKEWWFEREGEGVVQPRQSRKARIEAAATRRWLKERQLLRQNVWDEEEADFEENRQ